MAVLPTMDLEMVEMSTCLMPELWSSSSSPKTSSFFGIEQRVLRFRLVLAVLLHPVDDDIRLDGDVLDRLPDLHDDKSLLLEGLENVIAPASRHLGNLGQFGG